MLPATTTTKYPFWPKSSTDYLLFLFQIHLSVSCFPGNILDFMLNFHSSEAHINPFPALSTSHDITGSLAVFSICLQAAVHLPASGTLMQQTSKQHFCSAQPFLETVLGMKLHRQKCTAVAMKGLIFREFHRIYSVRCSWAVSLSPWKSSARAGWSKRESSVPGSTPVSPSQELSLIKSIVPACSGRPSKSGPLSALHQFAVWTPVSVSVLPGTEFLSC